MSSPINQTLFDLFANSRTQEYDRLGHTLAPYELEHCERWASEIALGEGKHEHGRQGPGEKKGGRQGTATGTGRKSKLFCGVFNLFSKIQIAAAAAACSCSYCCDKTLL
jgi:hypothetical protein